MEGNAPHQLGCAHGYHDIQRPLQRLPLHLLLPNEHAPHEVDELIRRHVLNLAHLRHGLLHALRLHLAIGSAHILLHVHKLQIIYAGRLLTVFYQFCILSELCILLCSTALANHFHARYRQLFHAEANKTPRPRRFKCLVKVGIQYIRARRD